MPWSGQSSAHPSTRYELSASGIEEILSFQKLVTQESYDDMAVPFSGRSYFLENGSPLIFRQAYHTAIVFMRLESLASNLIQRGQVTTDLLRLRSEMRSGVEKMRQKIEILGHRWYIAGQSLLPVSMSVQGSFM